MNCDLVDPQRLGNGPLGRANVHRRHMSKGQLAMVVVKAELFESNNLTQEELAEEHQVNRSRLAKASAVQNYAPDLVDLVISGHLGLDAAYQTASGRRRL